MRPVTIPAEYADHADLYADGFRAGFTEAVDDAWTPALLASYFASVGSLDGHSVAFRISDAGYVHGLTLAVDLLVLRRRAFGEMVTSVLAHRDDVDSLTRLEAAGFLTSDRVHGRHVTLITDAGLEALAALSGAR